MAHQSRASSVHAGSRHRVPQKEFGDLSLLLWGCLRRRAWQSAAEILRAIGAVLDQMPIDFMKGAVELTRRRFTADRICKFLRQVQAVQDKTTMENGLVQTKLYRAFIISEVAFHLCRMGYLAQAYENMKVAASQPQFASMTLFHAYTGIIGIELVKAADDRENVETRAVLADAVEALRRSLQMEPDWDVLLLYLVEAAGLSDGLVDAGLELEQFTARNQSNPFGQQLLFEHLRKSGPSDELFQVGHQTVMLDPASASFADLVELFAPDRTYQQPLARLCIHRLQYVWYDLIAWRTLAISIRDLDESIAPDEWWIDLHFRHPRAMARELGLSFDEPEHISNALQVPVQETVVDALEHKIICASYLLENGPESRFVVETIRALINAGQIVRVSRLNEELAPVMAKRRRTCLPSTSSTVI